MSIAALALSFVLPAQAGWVRDAATHAVLGDALALELALHQAGVDAASTQTVWGELRWAKGESRRARVGLRDAEGGTAQHRESRSPARVCGRVDGLALDQSALELVAYHGRPTDLALAAENYAFLQLQPGDRVHMVEAEGPRSALHLTVQRGAQTLRLDRKGDRVRVCYFAAPPSGPSAGETASTRTPAAPVANRKVSASPTAMSPAPRTARPSRKAMA
jgi:hypothetical protein